MTVPYRSGRRSSSSHSSTSSYPSSATIAHPANTHHPVAMSENKDSESQWIFTEEELLRTPSALDGISPESEREQRGKGCNFILQMGIQLKLPQLTLATASVFLHRFYMQNSLKKHHYYVCPLWLIPLFSILFLLPLSALFFIGWVVGLTIPPLGDRRYGPVRGYQGGGEHAQIWRARRRMRPSRSEEPQP